MLSVVFQHTPVVKIEYSLLRLEVHDIVAELDERFSLQWLCEVVRDHVVCRTVFDFKLVILEIDYCLTDNMVADYFTKPLQGKKFFQFRKTIMNLKS